MIKDGNGDRYFNRINERDIDLRRRVSGKERKTFEVNKMWEIHKEIARMLTMGYKNVEIADSLDVTPEMVSYVRNSAIVQETVEGLSVDRDLETIDIMKDIKLKAPEALKILENIISGKDGTIGENSSPTLRAKTAENWLDRAGFPAQRAGVGMHLHAHFNADDLVEVKKRARESGIIIDGEVVE